MGQYLPILMLMVLAVLFAALSFVASGLLAPRRPNDKKAAPYECGIVPGREPPQRFPVRFYLVAMIFIVFDIEIIFFFPYAVQYEALAGFGLVTVLIFAAGLFESFVYLIGNGALPAQHPREILDSLPSWLREGLVGLTRTEPAEAVPADRRLRPVFEAIPRGEAGTVEAIAERCGKPIEAALALLLELELTGWVRRYPGPSFWRRG